MMAKRSSHPSRGPIVRSAAVVEAAAGGAPDRRTRTVSGARCARVRVCCARLRKAGHALPPKTREAGHGCPIGAPAPKAGSHDLLSRAIRTRGSWKPDATRRLCGLAPAGPGWGLRTALVSPRPGGRRRRTRVRAPGPSRTAQTAVHGGPKSNGAAARSGRTTPSHNILILGHRSYTCQEESSVADA